jgi:hypothetical protein
MRFRQSWEWKQQRRAAQARRGQNIAELQAKIARTSPEDPRLHTRLAWLEILLNKEATRSHLWY